MPRVYSAKYPHLQKGTLILSTKLLLVPPAPLHLEAKQITARVSAYITTVQTLPCLRNGSNIASATSCGYVLNTPFVARERFHWLAFHAWRTLWRCFLHNYPSYNHTPRYVSSSLDSRQVVCVHASERFVAPRSNGDMLACTHTSCA